VFAPGSQCLEHGPSALTGIRQLSECSPRPQASPGSVGGTQGNPLTQYGLWAELTNALPDERQPLLYVRVL
jgi:hypothetical protein